MGPAPNEKNLDNLVNTDAKLVEYAQRARANINMMRRYEKDMFMNIGDGAKTDEYRKKWDESLGHFPDGGTDQATEVVRQTSPGAQESAMAAAKLNDNAKELQRLVNQFIL